MVGIGLTITGNGYDFNFNKIGLVDSNKQNIVVTLGTQMKTDIVYPGKGTNLNIFFVGKNFISQSQSQHLANFAALDALNFYKQFNDNTFGLEKIQIDASSLFLNSPNLKVNVIISENPENLRN